MQTPGVSLLELLVAIMVLGVLLGIGAPALDGFIRDNRRAAEVNAIVHAIHLARNAAVTQAQYVAICKSAAGTDCDGTHWEDGWILFVNRDRDDPPRRDAGERLLLGRAGWPHGTIRSNRAAFVFRPFSLRSTNGTLVFCDRRGPAAARVVIISYTGRPRTASFSAQGQPPDCP